VKGVRQFVGRLLALYVLYKSSVLSFQALWRAVLSFGHVLAESLLEQSALVANTCVLGLLDVLAQHNLHVGIHIQ
jgi:hypothetical protein